MYDVKINYYHAYPTYGQDWGRCITIATVDSMAEAYALLDTIGARFKQKGWDCFRGDTARKGDWRVEFYVLLP